MSSDVCVDCAKSSFDNNRQVSHVRTSGIEKSIIRSLSFRLGFPFMVSVIHAKSSHNVGTEPRKERLRGRHPAERLAE